MPRLSAHSYTHIADNPRTLAQRFRTVRALTQAICEPLTTEDYVVQSMPDVSPTKWHLAHTAWFFETFVLASAERSFQHYNPTFAKLFNSYYQTVGEQHPRPDRGLLTRPTVGEIFAYRHAVDQRMDALFAQPGALNAELCSVVEVGLHHEQQHQELILTDIKHVLSCNPLRPAYQEVDVVPTDRPTPMRWTALPEGTFGMGYAGQGFCYDNELPRHAVILHGGEIASRVVTNAEFCEFIADGGYDKPTLWLADGWARVRQDNWRCPLYWENMDGELHHFTLSGTQPLPPDAPVCHVSFFEAEAYARWAGARLPTEAEWEVVAADEPISGNFVESGRLAPGAPGNDEPDDAAAPRQLFGDVWEWTASPYTGYPGYRPPNGALGEYNGKFMCNQFVLRGGACVTPRTHMRATYRNYFPPDARWQFSGIRLAR